MPAFTNQELVDSSISIPPIVAYKFEDPLSQLLVEFALLVFIPLACPML